MKKTLNYSTAEKILTNLTFKNLQREVIKRGMRFEEISKCDYNLLASWFINNYYNPIDDNLLKSYDIWLTEILNKRNVHPSLVHPLLGYGYLEVKEDEIKEESQVKTVKVKKTSQGIIGGTKKAMTYELASNGVSKKETIEKVIEKYPEASIKSIGIWYNKALKSLNS